MPETFWPDRLPPSLPLCLQAASSWWHTLPQHPQQSIHPLLKPSPQCGSCCKLPILQTIPWHRRGQSGVESRGSVVRVAIVAAKERYGHGDGDGDSDSDDKYFNCTRRRHAFGTTLTGPNRKAAHITHIHHTISSLICPADIISPRPLLAWPSRILI